MTYIILLVGICASACSFVFLRESTEPAIMLSSYRVLLAGLLLLPVYLHNRKVYGDETYTKVFQRSWLPGVILGVHFIAWTIGARLTPAANANLIVTLMPVAMPFFMVYMFKERMTKREWLATAIAVGGMILLTANDFNISKEHFIGDAVCLVAMVLFAWYLALARSNRKVPTVWLYIVPVYLIAGLSSFGIALFDSSPFHHYTAYNLLMIFLVAAVSTVIGHSALNYAMQRLRGQTVTVLNMCQFVIAGIVAYYLYNEVPTIGFYAASLLLLVAMGLIMTGSKSIEVNSEQPADR